MKKHVIELIERSPDSCGVYLMKGGDQKILYVGKALRLRDRLRSYVHPERDTRPSVQLLVPLIEDVEWLITATEKEALLLENSLIKSHRPKYNISFRDDRSYVSLKITQHAFPRLHVTRKIFQDGGKYFGPYSSSNDVRRTLKLVQKIFKLRDCSDAYFNARKRPCLQYQIKRCSAPCVNYISEEAYAREAQEAQLFLHGNREELTRKLKKEMKEASEDLKFEQAAALRDRLASVEATLEPQIVESRKDDRDADVLGIFGDSSASLVKVLKVRKGRLTGADEHFIEEPITAAQEILRAILQSYYLSEKAGGDIPSQLIFGQDIPDAEAFQTLFMDKYGKKTTFVFPQRGLANRLLDLAQKNAESSFEERKRKSRLNHELLDNLRRHFNLSNFPKRIEGYDISNFHGASPIGSMVVFVDGEPDKRQYRGYNIKTIKGSNDFGMLREMFLRRFAKVVEGGTRPDLVLVDGGKGQLAQAVEVLKELNIEGIDVMSIAKEKELKSRSGKKYAPERFFFPGRKNSVVLPPSSKLLHLLQRVRDESHRNGITKHRKGRKKATLQTVLSRIPGVGAVKQKTLLIHFGSVDAILASTLDQLEQAPGLNKKTARAVYDFFHSSMTGMEKGSEE